MRQKNIRCGTVFTQDISKRKRAAAEELRLGKIKIICDATAYFGLYGLLEGRGQYGNIKLIRDWKYWRTEGQPIPLKVARIIFEQDLESAVRVNGFSGGIDPSAFASIINDAPHITHYHIDTTIGLEIFAKVLRKNKIIK